MRRISASWIFTLSGPPLKNGIIEMDESGYITALSAPSTLSDTRNTEFLEGIIVPGFVNAHCHLELSHLKNRIPEKRGIGHFLGKITKQRDVEEQEIIQAAFDADRKMFREGIVAVGDISNTPVTIGIKIASPIEWLTFVEVFGFHPSRAERAIETAKNIHALFKKANLHVSIVPHSPYSVSDVLFGKIAELEGTESSIITIHNQESKAEKQFFMSGDGPIMEHISQILGLDTAHWRPSGKPSLETVLPLIPSALPLLLVHNTFSTLKDIRFLQNFRGGRPTWLVLCPNSNLYIEDRLPPVQLFRSEKMPLCLGTDSLASNSDLSVLSEIKTLHYHFPDIPLLELFTWACLNGARALGMDDRYGSMEPGKKPGILQITSVNLNNMSLTRQSDVHRLA